MAQFWFFLSVLIIVSMATLASPTSRSRRSNDEDSGVTPIIKAVTNGSWQIPLTGFSATTFERHPTGITTETDVTNKIGTTFLRKETTGYLTRETRAARSRSRGRSSNGRSTKRTSSGKSATTVNGRSRSSSSSSSSSSDQRSPDPKRGGGSSSSLTCDDVLPCGSHPPGLLDVVRRMLSQLYRVLSDILQNEFSPPDPVRNEDLIVMINFLHANGGDRGRRFLREVSQLRRKLGPLWEQCCQTYVVGRRRKRAVMQTNEPIDVGEFILALLAYDVER